MKRDEKLRGSLVPIFKSFVLKNKIILNFCMVNGKKGSPFFAFSSFQNSPFATK